MPQTEHGYRRPLPLPAPRHGLEKAREKATEEAPEKPRGGAMRGLVGVARFLVARPQPAEVDANLKIRLGLSCAAELRSGLRVLLVAVAIVGVWGGFVPLSGAVVMSGSLVSETHTKKAQHPTGGVISAIAVHDGDLVKAGDLLVRLDDTAARANLQTVVGQNDAVRARLARLLAERDAAADVTPPSERAGRLDDKDVAAINNSERSLFHARRVSRDGQRELLVGRIGQLEEEIRGLDAQMKSQTAQRDLIASEVKGVETLYQKQLVPLTRLTTLQREGARLDGAQGQLVSSAAETRSKIDEAKLQVARLDQDFRAEVMKDLRDSQDKAAELNEREVAAKDVLDKIEIRAPTSGIVHQLSVHTVGGVVSPGEVLMEIVPENDALQIEANLSPRDIDQVHVGQSARVRFPAFNQRTTPEFGGAVTFVSADATHDAKSGAAAYLVRIDLSKAGIERLGALKLVPGMPAEVFLETGDRTMLSYLFKPISDQFARVFREQ